MSLIDRYIYAVKNHLPSELREDIGMELRANIEDMLPEDYTEEDVYQVLKQLGSPLKLANEYNPKKRYLIGPAYYDKYLSILKMVIGICIAVFVGIGLMVWIIESPTQWYQSKNITKLFSDVISSGISGIFQAIFWVTIVFIIIERSGAEAGYLPFLHKEWTPEDLPVETLDSKRKISRGETIFSMFFTILFPALIYFKPELFSFFQFGNKDTFHMTPLFQIERLKEVYFPIILVLALIQFGLLIWKYVTERWNQPLVIINVVYNIAISILTIVMLSDPSFLNTEFFQVVAGYAKVSAATITTWINKSKQILGLVIVVICIWDSIETCIRYYKPKQLNAKSS